MGSFIKWYDTIDSTNSEAIRQFEQCDDFTVYAAKYQTGGRGQKGTKWESETGKNLTFSLIIKPSNLKARTQFVISQIVTVGLKNYLNSAGIDAKIKWPNDIYVGDRKICGILIESFLSGDRLSGSVIGIGLNVNQRAFLSDAPNPVSMSIITGKEYNLEDELQELTNHINNLYNNYIINSIDGDNTLEKEYLNSLYRRDAWFNYEDVATGEVFCARIKGIDRSACLILERENGMRKSYSFKEVKYIL
ncbi:MAG: biotin--[acetyl-CoA-carboxylase] ligase [Bacteroidales bacterium]